MQDESSNKPYCKEDDHEWNTSFIFEKCVCPYNGSWNFDRTDLCTLCQGKGFVPKNILKCEKCGLELKEDGMDQDTSLNKCPYCLGTGNMTCISCSGSGSISTSSFNRANKSSGN